MPWGDDWHRHGFLDCQPATTTTVEHEFEDTVFVGKARMRAGCKRERALSRSKG